MDATTYAAVDRLVQAHCGGTFDAGIAARLRLLSRKHVDPFDVQGSIMNLITDRCARIGEHMTGQPMFAATVDEWSPKLRQAVGIMVDEALGLLR